MTYIRLHYLYRDAHNYKRHNNVVFSNESNYTLEEIEHIIRGNLIGGEWFDHVIWNLPDLHFGTYNCETDHCWHEYAYVEWCVDANPIVHDTIESFVERIARSDQN